MSKVPMIFEIKLPVDEAQNKIRVREKSYSEACDRSPIPNFLIINGFRNDSANKRVSDGIHCFNINLQQTSIANWKFPWGGLELNEVRNLPNF